MLRVLLMGRTVLLWVLLTGLPTTSHAEIYKTVDEHGNVVFTDSPRDKQADLVDLPPTNTQPPQVPVKRKAAKPVYPAPTHYDIQITSPKDQTQVPPGQQNVAVSTSVKPPLFPGHKLQILINGNPVAESSQANGATLKEIYRGTHQIQARVINQRGKTISTSAPVTIYVHRVSMSK